MCGWDRPAGPRVCHCRWRPVELLYWSCRSRSLGGSHTAGGRPWVLFGGRLGFLTAWRLVLRTSIASCSKPRPISWYPAPPPSSPRHVVPEPTLIQGRGHRPHLLTGTRVKESVAILKLPHLTNVFWYFVGVVNKVMPVLCGCVLRAFSRRGGVERDEWRAPSPSTFAQLPAQVEAPHYLASIVPGLSACAFTWCSFRLRRRLLFIVTGEGWRSVAVSVICSFHLVTCVGGLPGSGWLDQPLPVHPLQTISLMQCM